MSSPRRSPNEWRTPPLWGVADSAPYFHDGGSATLQDAILRHRGQAKSVLERYTKLSACEQKALTGLQDLMTLRCAPDDPAALARTLVAMLQGPEQPLDQRIAAASRFSYSELAARYLA